MKRPRPFLAPAAACLLSILAILTAPASAQTLRPPEIESIAVDALGARVSINVPVGTRRIVLESTRREDLLGWTPRAVRRLDGTAQTVVIDLAADAHHELLRVRAEDSDPLAAFALGRTNIAPTPLPAGTTPLLRNGEVVYDSAGQPPSTTPNANANTGGGGGQRTVTESDIWKVRGSRLYFFNQLRGLQSVDVTTPDAPRLLGTLSFPAAGEQLYAPDDQHVVLLLREDCRGNGFNGAAVVIVNVAEPQPREIARLPVAGRLFESRMVGTALYVASQTYEEATPRNGVWEMATVVSSFDLANPAAPVARDSRRIPGSASVVAANASFFFVGLDVYHDARPRTTVLHALDISSPDGAVAAFATLELDGWIRDKFKLDVQDDVLRVVLETQEKSDRWSPITRLSTWRLQRDGAGSTKPLGQLDLGAGENLFGTRFDGNRAYIVTFRRVDPLWIVDLTDPTQPKVLGELEIPGWSNYLHPLGDRLLTVGIDNTTNWRAAVQLFDVSNPAKPALLAKVPLGEQWSSTEANSDEKALGVFPADGLVLIPFSGASTNGYVQGVQIIDLGQDTLKARGVISHPELTPRRSTVLGARVLSLSARELLTVDIADRDQPKVTASLDLSRRADRVVTARQHLLTFSGTDLQVASLAAPDDVLSTTSLGKLPVLGAVARGDQLYVLQGVPASVTWNQEPAGDQWVALTNAGLLQLRVLSLAQLPALTETGTLSVDHEFTSGGVFDPLWPSETTLVWASRDTGVSYRYWLDMPMPIDLAPGGGVAFVDPGVTSRGLAAVALPVDGRIAFWPGRWWGQPQSLFAFDVTQPAAPVYRGATLSASGAVRASKAYAGTGTVLFSEEFQESSVVGSNKVTWLESIYTLVTNSVLKTNIIATPIQEWVTNTTKVTEVFQARRIPSPSTPHGLAAGAFHSLVLGTQGSVLSWGDNASRVNPDGSRRDPAVPETVPLLPPATALAGGTYHSLAATADGVWTWQSMDSLTVPPTPEDVLAPAALSTSPARVPRVPTPSAIAAGHRHSAAIAGSSLWTWGNNSHGQLGRPAADAELPPAEITELSPAQVAAGAYHTLVLRTDGSVTGFGRNDQRQLGITLRASDTDAAGTSTQPGVDFATVPLPRPAVAVAAGAYHGAALLDDGTVWTWGRNKEGQLGRAEIFDPGTPGEVPGLPRIRSLAASALSTLAIDENGALWLWGQLDPDSFETRRLPGQILDVTGALTVVAGRTHALVTAEGGTAFAFGNSDYAQLGHGEEFSVQAVFPELELIYQPVYTYVTNVVLAEEVRMEHSTREVIDWVPIVQWWQRHALTVVDYAAGGTAPAVRPTLAFPGELRGVSNGGEVLFSVAQKLEGTTNIVSREVLEVSGYDGVTVFVGDSLTLSTNSEVTSFVNVKADGHVLLSQGSWNNPSASRLRVLELAGARLNQVAEVPLLSGPQETQLLDQTLLVRGAGTLELWDLTSPAAPRAIPAVDHGCVWFSLRDAEGSAETGWWVPGGEYGTLRLAPR